MKKTFIGIDPGVSGGIAVVYSNGDLSSWRMPSTERDVFEVLQNIFDISCAMSSAPILATIEKVGGFIGKNQPASRAFKFGHSYGGLRMALIALEIPFDEVVPRKWQQAVGVISKSGESKTEHKNRLKAKAQQLFPQEKITLATADAILLAVYCQKTSCAG